MKSTYIVAAFMCLILVGAVGFVIYKETRPTASIQPAQVAGKKTTAKQQSNEPVASLSQPKTQAGDSIPLGGSSSSSNSNKSQPKVLQPDQFKEYDAYIGSDQYLQQDIQAGTGDVVVAGKKVAVFYRGWLTDGTVFDESRADESGTVQPFVFTPGAGQVITGWEQGVVGMKVGGVRRLVLPPAAAYGEAGQGSIPPNSVLVFDIQVAEVEK